MNNHYSDCKGGCGMLICDNNSAARKTGLCKSCRYREKNKRTSFSCRNSLSGITRRQEKKVIKNAQKNKSDL